jgi:hypothetical protein
MNNSGSIHIFDIPARVISVIFHPLLMPVYGMAIIFSAPTLYGYIPFAVKKVLLLIVLVNNVLLPLSILPFFLYWNIISTWTISDRRERIIPLILTTILYSLSTFIIFRLPVPAFLKSYILAASSLSLLVTIINFWWKISLHSVGAGALIAIVLILSFKMYTPLLWYLIPAIIAGGLLLTSRLQLNLHNPLQVSFGLLIGLFGLSFIMMLF